MNLINQSAPALLRSVLTASQNGVLVYRVVRGDSGTQTNLRLIMLNAVAERDLKQPSIDVLGQSFGRVFPYLAQTGIVDRYRQVIETGQPDRFEIQTILPGQTTPAWLDVSVVRMEDSIVISYNDITGLKASAETERLARVFQQAFDTSVNGITVFEAIHDEDGRISDFRFIRINEAGLRMSGYTRNELLGRSLWEIYPATSINGLYDQYVNVYVTGQSASGEHYYPEYDIWRAYTIVQIQGGVMVTYADNTAHKKMEERASKQTQLLENLLEGVPIGIAVLDAVRDLDYSTSLIVDFRITRINTVLLEALHRPGSEVAGQLLSTTFQHISKSDIFSRCVMSTELGEPQKFEMLFFENGDQSWYRVSIAPQDNQLILAFTDITETKQVQLAHHKQAELLQTISDNTPAGLVLWEAVRDDMPERNLVDFRYQMSNQMNNYITGHTNETLIGKDLLAISPRFRGTDMEAALRDAVETGCTQRMVFTYYTEQPGGWFDAQFIRVGDGVLMTFMDVTEAHKAQISQKMQADLLATIIDAQPAGLVLFNSVRQHDTNEQQPGPIIDFTYALVNKAEIEITGRSADKLIGQYFNTLFPSEDGRKLFESMLAVAETGQRQEWLMPFYADGIEGWFKSSLIKHGNQVLFTFLDVTELKKEQQALELANLELLRSNDNLQQFAYVASHDLQEPLRKIQSFGSMLATNHGVALGEDAQDLISRMQVSAERMSGLIRDLLIYSRVSTQRIPFQPVSLSGLMVEIIDDLYVPIEESGAIIETDELPVVMGDQEQLRQLFQNLLSNAIKFRLPNVLPSIQITHRTVKAKDLPASAVLSAVVNNTAEISSRKRYFEINVSDNGIGFDEKYLDRIFQVFQRLHGKNTYPGTGVGLAICRKVIENHSGLLRASSQPGAGATFSIYLPVSGA